jgi:hypothetical protein
MIQQVIEARTDYSQYLIHWTDSDRFHQIVRDGYFKASRGDRTTDPLGGPSLPTIADPAVCFSEMPIGHYLQAIMADSRYSNRKFGIAIRKQVLYQYGARPVLYGDELFKARLAREYKYLFCHFDYHAPNRGWIDWTHEREWRVQPNQDMNVKLGLPNGVSRRGVAANILVPIHFPLIDKQGIFVNELSATPQFVMIVEAQSDKTLTIDRISKTLGSVPWSRVLYSDMVQYRHPYLIACTKASMVSLEEVRDKRDTEGRWRLEDFVQTSD